MISAAVEAFCFGKNAGDGLRGSCLMNSVGENILGWTVSS